MCVCFFVFSVVFVEGLNKTIVLSCAYFLFFILLELFKGWTHSIIQVCVRVFPDLFVLVLLVLEV